MYITNYIATALSLQIKNTEETTEVEHASEHNVIHYVMNACVLGNTIVVVGLQSCVDDTHFQIRACKCCFLLYCINCNNCHS